MRRGGVFALRATLLRFQVPEEEDEGDEEGEDEDGEDGLEDEGEKARESRNGPAGFLHALDDLMSGSIDGAGAEEGESGDLCGAIAGGEGNSRTSQYRSRLRIGGEFSKQLGGRCGAIAAAEIQCSRDGDRFREGEGDVEGVWFVGSFPLEGGLIERAAEREILRRSSDGEGEGGNLPVIASKDIENFPLFHCARVDGFPEDHSLCLEKGIGGGTANGQSNRVVLLRALEYAPFLVSPYGTMQWILNPEGAEGTLPFLVFRRRLEQKGASREEKENAAQEQGKRAVHRIPS